jgi:glycosyltransferase involved in cell wall biosynthesis
MIIGIDIRNIGKKRTGDEAVFLNLVKNLAKTDSTNQYLLLTDITNTDDISILRSIEEMLEIKDSKNFKIISLKTSNKFTWNFWTLSQYLRKNRVDVYHTQYILPFFVPKSTKLVTHIHDISFNFYPQFIKWTDLFFLKTLIPWSIRRADKVIAVSEFTKKEIIKFYQTPEEKIEVVYNSIGENSCEEYSKDEIEKVKKKYNLPEKFLLYVGTLQPRKNIPFLINGFALLRDKMPDYKLVLVGKKGAHNYDKEIDVAIEKNNLQGTVLFTGYVEGVDLPAIYQLADIFVLPSLYEGFGIPILEAMKNSVPVVASDIPVFREVAKEAAEYFDIQSLDKFTEVVYNISINSNLRDRLINSAKIRINVFSWEKSAQRILEIYQKINN